MSKLDSKRKWMFLTFAGIVLVFAGFQLYGLHSNKDQLLIDVLSIVTSLGLIGALIALSNRVREERELSPHQAAEATQSNSVNPQTVNTESICNDEADEYFSNIKGELHQVERLVSDAVNNLVVNFRYISQLTRTHHDMVLSIEKMMAPKDAEPMLELLKQQIDVADKIEQELETAVTSLQFGDLVTQLLAHTARQVETLNLVLQRLDRQHDPERDLHAIRTGISKAVGVATVDRKRKPVVQQGMQMGEVELF